MSIKIRQGAVLDDKQRRILARIEPFTDGHVLEVTRGHSSEAEQLATIEKFAAARGSGTSRWNPRTIAPIAALKRTDDLKRIR